LGLITTHHELTDLANLATKFLVAKHLTDLATDGLAGFGEEVEAPLKRARE
jgi:hypothetical protein